MKNREIAFSKILICTLIICGIGLLWVNGSTYVNSVKAVKYYSSN